MSLIQTIAPALRALSMNADGQLPRVRFTETQTLPATAISFTPPTNGSPAEQIEALRAAMAGQDDRTEVFVPGLGLFSIKEPTPTTGRASGKIAVVTGAAQGFGYEIALGLVAHGATVVLTDINEEGARSAAQAVNEQYGPDRALGLAINVTNGPSIANAIEQVTRHYGGFDLFISNAGVLKAESVKTQPEKDFDFVTAVNYKGYYLCVQKAVPVLAAQHLARPEYRSDIVQINSKSGLVGSNRNFAYAGGKFGGIGLTQSFALELVDDGIKVNSVCPGNFFDGPLWSDPENGLFVQYLRANKVPGARTVADVKAFYESKVPMGRGCQAEDVTRAILYLMEQQYETGQALPVTGGQVMLH